MIAGDCANGAAHVDDFGGSEFGRQRGDHPAARHGNLNITETQKRMATEIDTIGLHRGNRTCGVDRGIALNKNHAGHVTGNEAAIIRPRRGCAALRGHEAVALQLICELLKRGWEARAAAWLRELTQTGRVGLARLEWA